jgi:hypothetical protein
MQPQLEKSSVRRPPGPRPRRPDALLFATIEGLQKQSGVSKRRLRRLVLKELADNGLDAADAAGRHGQVEIERLDPNRYRVADQGAGMPGTPEEPAKLFALERPMVSGKFWRAPAVLSYLFHRIEDRFDGRPTLLIVDEGWLALDDRGFAGQLREWLKTLRKKNASVIFATQSLADIDGSAIAPAIIESCPTRLFLPNERALEPQIATIYRSFGLNDRQIEILSRATPKRDYYCQSRRGNRLFELGLSEVALAFTAASSKTDQAAIASIVAAEGRDGFAAAWLRGKGLDWAADMLTTRNQEISR